MFIKRLLLILPALMFTNISVAQESDLAEQQFREGAEAFAEGRIADAREAFTRSLAANPSVGTAFRLSLALERAGFLLQASELLVRLEAGEFGELSESQRPHVEALLASTNARISSLRLEMTPADAAVRIDGESTAERVIRLDPGAHQIVALADGYVAAERAIELGPGEERTIAMELQVEDATLIVTADEDEHSITVEGVGSENGTFRRQVPPGDYVVTLVGSGRRREVTVHLDAGEVVRLRLELPSRRRPWAWVVGALVLGGAATATGLLIRRSRQVVPPIENPEFGGVINTLQRR